MWTRPLLAALFLPLLAGAAVAGAWPREKGQVFLSGAARLNWPQELEHWTSYEPTGQYYTLYLEYGLTDRITVGFDLGRSVSGNGKSVGFLRLPVRDKAGGLKIAAELGLGKIDGHPVIRPGLSLGLGLERGWLAADGFAEIAWVDDSDYIAPFLGVDYKLDLTWGRNLARDRKLILQVQTGKPWGEPFFARFAPSLVLPVTDVFSAELGVTWGATGDSSMGVLLGFWSSF